MSTLACLICSHAARFAANDAKQGGAEFVRTRIGRMANRAIVREDVFTARGGGRLDRDAESERRKNQDRGTVHRNLHWFFSGIGKIVIVHSIGKYPIMRLHHNPIR